MLEFELTVIVKNMTREVVEGEREVGPPQNRVCVDDACAEEVHDEKADVDG